MKDFNSINDLELLKRVAGAKLNSMKQENDRLKQRNSELETMLIDSEDRFKKLFEDKMTDQEKYTYFEKTSKRI